MVVVIDNVVVVVVVVVVDVDFDVVACCAQDLCKLSQ